MWDVLSGVAEIAWDVLSGAAKMAWDVLSGVTKTAWDVLSGVADRCGKFCPGCQKMAWDVLSRDVLSYIRPSRMTIAVDLGSKATKQTNKHLIQCMRFPTMWYVRPAKPQISLRIRAV